jgi:hypothetical protein
MMAASADNETERADAQCIKFLASDNRVLLLEREECVEPLDAKRILFT